MNSPWDLGPLSSSPLNPLPWVLGECKACMACGPLTPAFTSVLAVFFHFDGTMDDPLYGFFLTDFLLLIGYRQSRFLYHTSRISLLTGAEGQSPGPLHTLLQILYLLIGDGVRGDIEKEDLFTGPFSPGFMRKEFHRTKVGNFRIFISREGAWESEGGDAEFG